MKEDTGKNVRCPKCRQENVFLDRQPADFDGEDKYIFGSKVLLYRGSRKVAFEEAQNSFWNYMGFGVWLHPEWYCHLCNYRLRYPKSWIAI